MQFPFLNRERVTPGLRLRPAVQGRARGLLLLRVQRQRPQMLVQNRIHFAEASGKPCQISLR